MTGINNQKDLLKVSVVPIAAAGQLGVNGRTRPKPVGQLLEKQTFNVLANRRVRFYRLRPLGSGLRDERLFAIWVEPRGLIEAQRRLVFAASEQHDFIASHCPSMRKGSAKESGAVAVLSMSGMGNHILDYTIGPATAREIGYDGDSATRYQFATDETAKVSEFPIRHYLHPHDFDFTLRWQRVI